MKKLLFAIILGLLMTSLNAQNLMPTSHIWTAATAADFKGGYTFAYATSGTPWNGSLISYGGFEYNNYDTQISSSYEYNRISFRTRNGDINSWNSWQELATKGANDFVGDQNINGNVGIGTKNPIEKFNINGGTGDGTLFDARIALTKVSSTGNVQSAKIVLSDDDTNWANLSFKVKTTASRSEIESFYTDALTIKGSNANVGIGTNNPIEKLNINGGTGDGTLFDARIALTKVSSTGNVQSAKIVLSDEDTNWANLSFKVKTTASRSEIESFYTDALTIKASNAYVGIGTTSPDSKLTVAGNIHAREVKVTVRAGEIPDYVFANDYKLRSLQEIEEYVKENSHLPEIPSAKEIEKNGLMLAEMNMSLLKKMEEMTLYMIEMKKENENLKSSQRLLEERIKKIETK